MSIAKSLRDNAALVAGILLPVLVVILFLLSSWIPRMLVDPPQYDFLYAQDAGYYGSPSTWRHQITLDPQGHLLVKAFTAKPKVYAPGDRLFLSSMKTATSGDRFAHSAKRGGRRRGIVVEVPEFLGVH
jgi:hypothetical protein